MVILHCVKISNLISLSGWIQYSSPNFKKKRIHTRRKQPPAWDTDCDRNPFSISSNGFVLVRRLCGASSDWYEENYVKYQFNGLTRISNQIGANFDGRHPLSGGVVVWNLKRGRFSTSSISAMQQSFGYKSPDSERRRNDRAASIFGLCHVISDPAACVLRERSSFACRLLLCIR